jgi:hypothetical protein
MHCRSAVTTSRVLGTGATVVVRKRLARIGCSRAFRLRDSGARTVSIDLCHTHTERETEREREREREREKGTCVRIGTDTHAPK